MRVAASSSASGRPSRRRQISVTAVTLSSVSAKVGAAAVARWQNRATDGTTAAASAPPGVNGGGTGSGCNGRICSPSTPSGSRLVASTVNPGQSRTRVSTRPATAPSTCSQLSSRRSIERPRRYSTSRSVTVWPSRCCTPSVVASRSGTAAAGHRGQLAHPGPVAVADRASAATRSASRVLPTPPTPLRVTTRKRPSVACAAAASPARPTRSDSSSRRFPSGRDAGPGLSVAGGTRSGSRRCRRMLAWRSRRDGHTPVHQQHREQPAQAR